MAAPEITALPTPPTRGDDPAVFESQSNAWVAALPVWTGEANALGAYLDGVAVDVEGFKDDAEQAVTDAQAQVTLAQGQVALASDEADRAEAAADNAAAQANFGGLWDDLTGAVSPPLSVYHEGQYWQLLVALADVTSVEPGTDVDTWLPMVETSVDIGQIVYSFDDLTSTALFVEPGMSYLQSAYPELFGVIGIGSAPPISKVSDPADLPGTNSRDVVVSTGDDYVVYVGQTDPKITLYSRSGDVLTREDFVNSTDAHVTVGGNSDLSLFLVGCLGSPYLKLYSRSGGTLTEETAPSTGMSGNNIVEGCGFSFDGAYAAMLSSENSFDNLKLYSVSGVTLTEVDAVDTPTAASLAVSLAMHPSQNYLACAFDAATTIELYSFSGGALVFEQSEDDAGGRANDVNFTRKSLQWSPDGNYLTLGCDNGLVRIFGFDAGVLTEIAQTFSGESGLPNASSATINQEGDFISMGFEAAPYFKVYDFADGVIGDGYTVTGAPSNPVLAAYSSPYTGYTYVVINQAPNIAVYKSDFPFDTATEFYVPDVDPLSPQQIGDWVPGVQGNPYVRAK